MADTWEIFLHIIHSFIPLKANIMILPLDRWITINNNPALFIIPIEACQYVCSMALYKSSSRTWYHHF
jgi:hypothetical protein